MPEVDEVADGIYRIATFVPRFGLTFNQFLIVDEQSLLFHTGHRRMCQETIVGVARLVEPAQLRWVSSSHLEADESGALNDFLRAAPMAEPVHSEGRRGAPGAVPCESHPRACLPASSGATCAAQR